MTTPRRLQQLLNRLMWRYPPGRAVEVLDDDAFLVSYPKSGNTWVRFTIANLLRPAGHVDFRTVHDIVPDIYRTSRGSLGRSARPRVIKSHECFDRRYPKVVYLVRDPRDVVLSYYHHHIRNQIIPEEYSLRAYVERFLEGELDRFGTWREHVGSWLGARSGHGGFLMVRYEDLTRDPIREFKQIVDFIGLKSSGEELEAAVRRCSFAEMRKLEVAQAKQGTLAGRRIEKPFLRSGQAGSWTQDLHPELAAQIASSCEPFITGLGYGAGGSPKPDAERVLQDLWPEAATSARS